MPVDYKLRTLRRLFGERSFFRTVKTRQQRLPRQPAASSAAAVQGKDTTPGLQNAVESNTVSGTSGEDIVVEAPVGGEFAAEPQRHGEGGERGTPRAPRPRRGLHITAGGVPRPFFHGVPPRSIRNKAVAGQLNIVHLFEKQKMRVCYGAMRDYQFQRYVDDARRSRFNVDAELMRLLETRLDTLLYRTGFVQTPSQARQWITHSQVLVNGCPLPVKSARLRPGDHIAIRDRFVERAVDASIRAASHREAVGAGASWILDSNAPEGLIPWMVIDRAGLAAVLVRYPTDNEVRAMCHSALFPYIRDAQLNPHAAMRAYR